MREIGKYRGQRKDNGEWEYGWLVDVSAEDAHSPAMRIVVQCKNGIAYIPIRPETAGEFTGLKVKNGVEIFAGDKYKWQGWEVRAGKQIRPERIGEIRNDTPEHWIEDCHKLWCISTGNSQGTVEVIGSIHEGEKCQDDT